MFNINKNSKNSLIEVTMLAQKQRIFLLCLLLGLTGCAEFKEAGRTIGHTTRDVTTAIGHASRDAAKSVKEEYDKGEWAE